MLRTVTYRRRPYQLRTNNARVRLAVDPTLNGLGGREVHDVDGLLVRDRRSTSCTMLTRCQLSRQDRVALGSGVSS